MTADHIFVYGTLKPGQRNHHIATRAGPHTTREATLTGYHLYHLHPENYPCITPGPPDATIHGYILTYHDWHAAHPHLDQLEGTHLTPPLYHRQRATATTPHGPQHVWIYTYAHPHRLTTPTATHLPHGHWPPS
ncbi:gamma-glutamylcyclotransferase family protein [Deinococcus yavapaiensis]|uniref:Gamma-glutamylcyclotransferase (GGCT)/AIG2-like uncharacterized protein YtfP n=1 Tax=Deinococcus yavapaiensis KR-236 TaxID=694435 RepID=A0A318SN67_9DEIO|nr:gamma-glutamylcyclotransferase [Deinococcus yavapaiensis]PYE54099.1 gamma-glutamylcyclotransferase (GGCT)/AIG2-like uncharacterized protein YtfP [Deinococcus yavapaiensis KR-236]